MKAEIKKYFITIYIETVGYQVVDCINEKGVSPAHSFPYARFCTHGDYRDYVVANLNYLLTHGGKLFTKQAAIDLYNEIIPKKKKIVAGSDITKWCKITLWEYHYYKPQKGIIINDDNGFISAIFEEKIVGPAF